MTRSYDVAVVGGGIAGLAHAWRAAERGLRVGLFERSKEACGATVRNFGMIWPVGQPQGEPHELALRSAALWRQLGDLGVVDVENCGSIHLAHRADELAVLEEFCDRRSHETTMLSPDDILKRSRLANPQGLLGGMWSASELRVDPRTAARRITAWLSDRIECHSSTTIRTIDGQVLSAADGRKWRAGRVVICSGSDLQTLFPAAMAELDLRLCKLQMLKAVGHRVDDSRPHIASGLTLRHYTSFQACPSLAALKQRIADESPLLDEFGIHVMASHFPTGEVILGDSHEYDEAISPFDKPQIDELMVSELRKVICLDDWTVRERWHGIYAKNSAGIPVMECEVEDDVHVFLGMGGAGMTMSFGLAERAWNRWDGKGS